MSITFEITQLGAILDKQNYVLSNNEKKILKKKFTIVTRTCGNRFTKSISKWKETMNFILLPRFGIIELSKNMKFMKKFGLKIEIVNKIEESITIPNISKVSDKNKLTMTDNQTVVINYIMKNIYNEENVKKGNSGLILKMEAGQGKSYIAMKLIKILCKKTLIIVHNISLLNQWCDLLAKYFPQLKIGKLYGKNKSDGHIVVAVIKSLLKDEYKLKELKKPISNISYLELFGFVIFDESHLYCSKMVSIIFNYCQRTYMLGLSATPKRETDRFDPVAYWNVGNVLDVSKIDGYNIKLSNNMGGIVTFIKYYGSNEYTKHILNDTTQMVSISKMLEQLVNDPDRINIIIKYTYELLMENHNIFIFADRRNYLLLIKDKLLNCPYKIKSEILDVEDNNMELDDKIVDLMGGSSPDKLKMAEEKSRVILTTYQYLGTGKSIPKMTSIILGTPRKTGSKQFINRIFRLGYKEKKIRNIIDIVDWKVCLKNQWYKRKKYYEERNFMINEKKIEYNNINI